ncbi:MAG: pentapeptide repeat-containing protein [Myxococcota bacterium]
MTEELESEHPGVEPGEFVADAEVGDRRGAGGGVEVFAATREDGSPVTVIAAGRGVSAATRDRFITSASELVSRLTTAVEDVAIPTAVDPLAYAVVLDVNASATLADVPPRGLDPERIAIVFQRVAHAVANLHREGLVHGCLCPEVVLLDEGDHPCVTNVQGVDIAAEFREASALTSPLKPYAASEVRYGRNPTTQSDVFSLGRLLHFLLLGATPDEPDQALPTLESLREAPVGLVQIIRKCTVTDFNDRYWDASGLCEDLDVYLGPDADAASNVGTKLEDKSAPRVPKRDEAAERVLRADRRREQQGAAAARRDTYRPGRAPSSGFASAVGGVFGAAVVIGAGIAGATVAGPGIQWLGVTLIGPLLLMFIVPRRVRKAWALRALVAVLAMATLVFVDPTGALEPVQGDPVATLEGSTVAERVAALRAGRAAGETSFLQNDFSGGDLSGLDLSRTQLDGSIFVDAKLVGANLKEATMINTDVGGADFSGANLVGLVPAYMKRWPESKCDAATKMPDGWTCNAKGEPAADAASTRPPP